MQKSLTPSKKTHWLKRSGLFVYHTLAVVTKSLGDFFTSLLEVKGFITAGSLSKTSATIILALSVIPLFILRWLKNLDKSQKHVKMLGDAFSDNETDKALTTDDSKTDEPAKQSTSDALPSNPKKATSIKQWALRALAVTLAGLTAFAFFPLLGQAFKGIFHFLGATGRAIPGLSAAFAAIFLTFVFLDTLKDLKSFWSELTKWFTNKWRWWASADKWKEKNWLNETLRVIGYIATAGMAVATGIGLVSLLPFSGPGAIILATIAGAVTFFTSANFIGDYLSQFKQRILWSLGFKDTDKRLKDGQWNRLPSLLRAASHALALSMAIGTTFLLVFAFPPALAIPVGLAIGLCSYVFLIQGLKDLFSKLYPKPSETPKETSTNNDSPSDKIEIVNTTTSSPAVLNQYGQSEEEKPDITDQDATLRLEEAVSTANLST